MSILVCFSVAPSFGIIAISACVVIFFLFLVVFSIHDLNFGYYSMIVLGFLLAFIDRATGSKFPLYSVIFLMPFALFIFLIVRGVFHDQRLKIERHVIIYLYFLTILYTIAQVFNPQMGSLMGWLSYFRQSMSVTALLLVSLYLFKDLRSIRFFLRFLMGAIFITALYGCIQQWIGLSASDRSWVYNDPRILDLFGLPGGGIRKFSFLTDPANFGTLMAAGVIATLILSWESLYRKSKLMWGVSTVIIFCGMSYSGTRTASIMVVAGLSLYFVMTIYQKRTQMLAIGAGLLFLFIMNVPIYGNATINRFKSAFKAPTHDASLDVRLINREKIRPYIYNHPFGGGLNTAGSGGYKYNPHHFLASIPPDSSLVADLMETGWVGLFLQLSFLTVILAYAVHYYYRCRNMEIKTYYVIIATTLFALGFIGAYAQYTLMTVPQIFLFIPFIAIVVKLHTFDIS